MQSKHFTDELCPISSCRFVRQDLIQLGHFLCVQMLMSECVCEHVYNYSCAQVHVYICLHICRAQKLMAGAFIDPSPLLLLRQSLSLNPERTDSPPPPQIIYPACPVSLCLCLPTAGITGRLPRLARLYTGSGDLNSCLLPSCLHNKDFTH